MKSETLESGINVYVPMLIGILYAYEYLQKYI